jgi:urease accessory protein
MRHFEQKFAKGAKIGFSNPVYWRSVLPASHPFVPIKSLAISFAALLSIPLAAHAHTEGGSAAGLLSGLQHPVSGWDHILAMIAVGLWGAQLGKPAIWVLPVAFPMVMAFGGMMGLLGIPVPAVEIGIALSAIVLGGMVLLEAKPPIGVATAIVGIFAIFHGHAHGTELPDGSSGLLYSIGFVAATGTLHGIGIAIGIVHKWKQGQVFLRVCGTFVALGGGWFLWSAVTG